MDHFVRPGLRFDVVDSGPTDGPAVVLLHGFPQQPISFEAVASRLNTAGLRTLTPSQRGYTRAERPTRRRDNRTAETAADVVALLDTAGLRETADVVERICAFAGLPYEPAMLEYEGTVDVSAKPHQQRLRQAPTPGVRDWRADMAPEDVAAFEAVAGDLLAELGYETVTEPSAAARARGRAALAAYAARTAAWRAAGRVVRRSPLWKRRHPPLA